MQSAIRMSSPMPSSPSAVGSGAAWRSKTRPLSCWKLNAKAYDDKLALSPNVLHFFWLLCLFWVWVTGAQQFIKLLLSASRWLLSFGSALTILFWCSIRADFLTALRIMKVSLPSCRAMQHSTGMDKRLWLPETSEARHLLVTCHDYHPKHNTLLVLPLGVVRMWAWQPTSLIGNNKSACTLPRLCEQHTSKLSNSNRSNPYGLYNPIYK